MLSKTLTVVPRQSGPEKRNAHVSTDPTTICSRLGLRIEIVQVEVIEQGLSSTFSLPLPEQVVRAFKALTD